MSDPREPVGEPVDEPTPVDDVVGQAHEGLAEAEAARRDRVDESAAAPTAHAGDTDAAADDRAAAASRDDRAAAASPEDRAAAASSDDRAAAALADDRANAAYAAPADVRARDADAAASRDDRAPADDRGRADAAAAADGRAADTYAPYHGADAYDDARVADRERAEPAAPAWDQPAYAAPGAAAPQPIFVQAPEEPRPRGNRGAAGAIGLVAAICFAVLYLAAGAVIGLVTGSITVSSIGTWLAGEVTTWGLWVPTVVFFLAFWLLGAILDRGRWGLWVVLGVLVGLAAYGGHILGQLFEAPFWMVSVDEGAKVAADQLFAPLAVAAFVIGRELTVWFSAWVAARGRRMTELNLEARREYQRTLEAGPQLADR